MRDETDISNIRQHLATEGIRLVLTCSHIDNRLQGTAYVDRRLIRVQHGTDVDRSELIAAILHEYGHIASEHDWMQHKASAVVRCRQEVTAWRIALIKHQEWTGGDFNEQQLALMHNRIQAYHRGTNQDKSDSGFRTWVQGGTRNPGTGNPGKMDTRETDRKDK